MREQILPDNLIGKHAERVGKIFNKHIPPEGGHPGEDYNCRCWAEPYRPEKNEDKPMIVDVSGLDMFKELQKNLSRLILIHPIFRNMPKIIKLG